MSFEFDFTADQLAALLPNNTRCNEWYEALYAKLPLYEITTAPRVAAFIAQCGHESMGFTALSENLNYSAGALTRTWPKRFPVTVAAQYARNPVKIANRAYCNRMGNGDEASGDGWKFHGRGLIQLTGRANYTAFADAIGMDLEDCVRYCETPEGAVDSAGWFWKRNGLNELADEGDMTSMTKRINGGDLGLQDRIARYERALEVLQE